MWLIAYFGTALIVTLVVMGLAAWIAKASGKNPIKWALSALLAIFVLVFWDYYPTKWVHQYYCEKEAGFWVYKTLDQWKKENPGVMETLVANKGASSHSEHFDDGHGRATTYRLNDYFNWIVRQQDVLRLLPIIREEQEVMDKRKNQVLARYIDFGAGNSVKNTIGPPGPLKFWLTSKNCTHVQSSESDIRQFKNKFRGVEK